MTYFGKRKGQNGKITEYTWDVTWIYMDLMRYDYDSFFQNQSIVSVCVSTASGWFAAQLRYPKWFQSMQREKWPEELRKTWLGSRQTKWTSKWNIHRTQWWITSTPCLIARGYHFVCFMVATNLNTFCCDRTSWRNVVLCFSPPAMLYFIRAHARHLLLRLLLLLLLLD